MFDSDGDDIREISNVLWEIYCSEEQLNRLDKAMSRMERRSRIAGNVFITTVTFIVGTMILSSLMGFLIPTSILFAAVIGTFSVDLYYSSRYDVVKGMHKRVLIDIVMMGMDKDDENEKERNDRIDDGQQ